MWILEPLTAQAYSRARCGLRRDWRDGLVSEADRRELFTFRDGQSTLASILALTWKRRRSDQTKSRCWAKRDSGVSEGNFLEVIWYRSGAVTGAVKDAEVGCPGTDGVAVLMGKDPGQLVDVGEVVHGPGCQKLRQGDGAEDGMSSAELELLRSEIEGAEFAEVGGAKFGELVEELGEGLPCTFAILGAAIERLEGAGLAVVENDFGTRHPVGAFAMVEMADDIVGSEGAAAFVVRGPGFGEIAQEHVDRCGSAGE